MKTAHYKIEELQRRLVRAGLPFDTDFFSVQKLRLAEMRLHRWGELECGMGDKHKSYCINRDEETGIPYMEVHPNQGKMRRYRIADREKGALARIAKICKEKGIYYFHQGDPRGCALYLSAEPLDETNYSRGVAVCD